MKTTLGAERHERTLRQLELLVTRRLDGLLHGDHQGLVPAAGTDLAEAREYRIGDDVRHMDWNLTARTTVPHVRDTVAERELETWLVIDRSASMNFGTARCQKRDLAVAAVAAFAFLANRAGNRTGAVLLEPGDTSVVPARSGREPSLALLHRLVGKEPAPGEGADDLATGLVLVDRLARRRGLVVVISDFLGDSDWERPLRGLSARHELLAIEVVDPRELELPDVGMLTVVDPESGRTLEVPTGDAEFRARFAAGAAAQRQAIATALRRAGAGHLQLRTDRDWLMDVVRFVADRRRAGSGGASR